MKSLFFVLSLSVSVSALAFDVSLCETQEGRKQLIKEYLQNGGIVPACGPQCAEKFILDQVCPAPQMPTPSINDKAIFSMHGQVPNDSWKGTMTIAIIGYDEATKKYRLHKHLEARFNSDGAQRQEDVFEDVDAERFSSSEAAKTLDNCEANGGTLETLPLAIGDTKTCKVKNDSQGYHWKSNVGPFPFVPVKSIMVEQGYAFGYELISYKFVLQAK